MQTTGKCLNGAFCAFAHEESRIDSTLMQAVPEEEFVAVDLSRFDDPDYVLSNYKIDPCPHMPCNLGSFKCRFIIIPGKRGEILMFIHIDLAHVSMVFLPKIW